MRVCSLTLIGLLLMAGSPLVCGQDTIRVIAMGQVGPNDCPLHIWFSAVPDIDYILVVTKQDIVVMTLEELRRWIRIYLPRTREELQKGFDHYIFVDSWLTGWESSPLMTPKQAADIKWSIGEGGLPVFATGIWDSKTPMTEGLLASDIEEYYPVDLSKPREMSKNNLYKVKVNDKPGLASVLKVFLPLGIERFQGQWVGELYPKQGTTIWATLYETSMPNPPPGGWPWLVSWQVGSRQTMFWVAADDMEVKWWWGFYNPPTENPYGVDILCNILYHSLGKDLPDDILLVHKLRRRFIEFNDRKALCLSVIEFAERFKANTDPLWREIGEVEIARKSADRAYLEHEFEESQEIMTRAEETLVEINKRAVKLKDASLLWVFVIEWLAVTAASMICGSILWTLMIKRRLYREVKTTRGWIESREP